jgi:hypothetical protein
VVLAVEDQNHRDGRVDHCPDEKEHGRPGEEVVARLVPVAVPVLLDADRAYNHADQHGQHHGPCHGVGVPGHVASQAHCFVNHDKPFLRLSVVNVRRSFPEHRFRSD